MLNQGPARGANTSVDTFQLLRQGWEGEVTRVLEAYCAHGTSGARPRFQDYADWVAEKQLNRHLKRPREPYGALAVSLTAKGSYAGAPLAVRRRTTAELAATISGGQATTEDLRDVLEFVLPIELGLREYELLESSGDALTVDPRPISERAHRVVRSLLQNALLNAKSDPGGAFVRLATPHVPIVYSPLYADPRRVVDDLNAALGPNYMRDAAVPWPAYQQHIWNAGISRTSSLREMVAFVLQDVRGPSRAELGALVAQHESRTDWQATRAAKSPGRSEVDLALIAIGELLFTATRQVATRLSQLAPAPNGPHPSVNEMLRRPIDGAVLDARAHHRTCPECRHRWLLPTWLLALTHNAIQASVVRHDPLAIADHLNTGSVTWLEDEVRAKVNQHGEALFELPAAVRDQLGATGQRRGGVFAPRLLHAGRLDDVVAYFAHERVPEDVRLGVFDPARGPLGGYVYKLVTNAISDAGLRSELVGVLLKGHEPTARPDDPESSNDGSDLGFAAPPPMAGRIGQAGSKSTVEDRAIAAAEAVKIKAADLSPDAQQAIWNIFEDTASGRLTIQQLTALRQELEKRGFGPGDGEGVAEILLDVARQLDLDTGQ